MLGFYLGDNLIVIINHTGGICDMSMESIEIYRELEYSTSYISYTPQETSSEGNSSGFIGKGIHLIMAFLCLLI